MEINEQDREKSKQDLILQTTLALVADLGLKGTTIAQISKRAQLSPGIIYYYFHSKDEILHTLYANIEQAFVDAVSSGDPLSMPILACYQHLWLNTYKFGLANPQALVFVESYQHSIYYQDRTSHTREAFLAKVQEKTDESIHQGELLSLPIEAIYAIVIRPAFELVKLQLAGVDFLSGTTIEEIALSICKSLLKNH
ncbi:MAG: TetR/AcrR family transcriptional regulator [Anaerolineales bacterium]